MIGGKDAWENVDRADGESLCAVRVLVSRGGQRGEERVQFARRKRREGRRAFWRKRSHWEDSSLEIQKRPPYLPPSQKPQDLCQQTSFLSFPITPSTPYLHIQKMPLTPSFSTAQCPREGCDGSSAFFYQVQIRSADEPMTTFYKVRFAAAFPLIPSLAWVVSGCICIGCAGKRGK